MNNLCLRWLAAVAVPVLVMGCGDGGSGKPKPAAVQQYDVRGKVIAIDAAKPAVTLDHEDIPGLMKAMQMEFAVENAKLMEGIRTGDQVQGRLKKSDSGLVITHLEKRPAP